jgi:hypothetical protein
MGPCILKVAAVDVGLGLGLGWCLVVAGWESCG